MQSRKLQCKNHASNMLYILSRRLRRLCSSVRWWFRRCRPSSKLIIKRLKHPKSHNTKKLNSNLSFNQNHDHHPIRLAAFNAALFSLAPAVPNPEKPAILVNETLKGILKQSPLHPMFETDQNIDNKLTRSKPKVSINLPDNEISLAAMRSPVCFPASWFNGANSSRTIYEVLKEVDADVLALQDVKAEEENAMRPLSDLARALGMSYVFAESWAPQYGNAVLSKWPIKKWRVHKICDDKDFRNVIKATIDVPCTGELNVYSTQLDHLDENWRTKQINAIIQSDDQPHILAGGLNSLDASDYSTERWNNIVKYYEELGKPTPKVEVTSFLRGKGYTDAKDFPGECEPVVMIAKGQNVQGTCKYGTRVDYILGSAGLPYVFVPGSYSVISSKGTSDHHIVKVDIFKVAEGVGKSRTHKKLRERVVRMSRSCSSRATCEISC